MRSFLIILALSIALASSGCGNSTASTTPSATSSTTSPVSQSVKLTQADSGKTASLAVGQTLEVTLDSNPTTGFHWVVASVDKNVVQQMGDPVYTPDPNSAGLVGAGGKDTFSFKAVTAGQTDLKMNYVGPDNQPSNTRFNITVTVN